MLKSPPSTRPKAVLKSAPSTLTRAPWLAIINCLITSYYFGTGDSKGPNWSIAINGSFAEANGPSTNSEFISQATSTVERTGAD